MEQIRNKYDKEMENWQSAADSWVIEREFVNYAVESSYYMYGLLMQDLESRQVDFSVLDNYGWDSDYHYMSDNYAHLGMYLDESGDTHFTHGSSENLVKYLKKNALTQNEIEELSTQDTVKGFLVLDYDAYGKLIEARLECMPGVRFREYSVYDVAKRSTDQYINNVKYYNGDDLRDGTEVIPRNFSAIFMIHEENGFVSMDGYSIIHEYDNGRLFFETGVMWIIGIVTAVVALFALLLPFIKPLHTGWEKLFCMPIEILVCLAIGTGAWFLEMCGIMSFSNTFEIERYLVDNGSPEIIGYALSTSEIYNLLLVLNFLGWALCFLGVYILAASLRQLLSRPVYYLKNRFLIVNILKWMFSPIKKFYHYVTDIDITKNLKSSIIKIVLANFVILLVIGSMWFFGWPVLILYSIGLYIVLKKYGSTIQQQYFSIINATRQMADGNLKIQLNEDLGMFEPIGNELTKIQQGFSKAVAEEAKSQQMKTELITNVSHDLKTPLTAIITYVNLLKNPEISEEERTAYIETLDQKSQRLKGLIEDLFEVSKANSGNVQMNFMDVDVVSLMKQIRLEMEDQIMNSGLLFRWNLPEEKIVLKLDGQRTYRVFENLINNILKYSMPGSRVFIDIAQYNGEVQLSFKNISLSELDFDVDRLTDRFVRGDASRNTEGSGLGLAIAKSFVELQNGTFKIDVDGDLFKVIITWPHEK